MIQLNNNSFLTKIGQTLLLITSLVVYSQNISAAPLNETQQAVADIVIPVCVDLNQKAGDEEFLEGTIDKQTSLKENLSAEEFDLLRRCADAIDAGGLAEGANGRKANDFNAATTALSNIAPDEISAQGTTSVKTTNIQQNNIAARVSALQSGARGFGFAGLRLDINGKKLTDRELSAMFLDHTTGGGASADDNVMDQFSRLGFFVNGSYNFGDRDGSVREAGFDYDTQGITIGTDYFITDKFIIGAAFGITNANIDMDDNGGGLDTDSTNLSIYGSFFHSEQLYINGFLDFGKSEHSSLRNINYTLKETQGGCCVVDLTGNDITVDQQARSKTDATQKTLAVDMGYELHQGSFTYGPTLSLGYSKIDIDGFSESMSNPDAVGRGLGLRIDAQKIESIKSQLGFQLANSASFGWGVLTQQVRFTWLREYSDNSRIIRANYIYAPKERNMDFATDNPDRNYFITSIDISATLSHGRSAFLSYSTIAGLDDITYNGIQAGVRMEF